MTTLTTLTTHAGLVRAADNDLDTIMQGLDGNDYIVVDAASGPMWELFVEHIDMPIAYISILPSPVTIAPKPPKSHVKNVKTTRGRPKKEKDAKPRTRAPTAYNIFLRETLTQLSQDYPQIPNNERMKMASRLWNANKNKL